MTKSKLYLDGILTLPRSDQERILADLEESSPADAELLKLAMAPAPSRLERLKNRILAYIEAHDGHASLRSLRYDLNFKRYGTDGAIALVALEAAGVIIRIGTGRRGDPKEIGLLKKS